MTQTYRSHQLARAREGGIDVSEIAKLYGGGGHRNAAGFQVPATGGTGIFGRGQLAPSDGEDEGDIRIAVAADGDLVRIDFGKPVAWLALPKENALGFAQILQKKASTI